MRKGDLREGKGLLKIPQLGRGRAWIWTQVSPNLKPVLFRGIAVCSWTAGPVSYPLPSTTKCAGNLCFGIKNRIPRGSNILVKRLSLVWETSMETGDNDTM